MKFGILLFALCATIASAQSAGVVGSAQAAAVYFRGTNSAGSLTTQSFDLIDFGTQKLSSFSLEANQLTIPSYSVNLFTAGGMAQFTPVALLSKTNLAADKVNFFVRASVGNGIPSTGSSHISWLAGGGINYQLTNTLTWQSLQVQYGRFGSESIVTYNTGLSFFFGSQSAAAAHSMARKMAVSNYKKQHGAL